MIISIVVICVVVVLINLMLYITELEKINQKLLSDLKKEYDAHGESRRELRRLRDLGDGEERN